MPDWLAGAAATNETGLRMEHALIRQLVALLMGIIVAAVFRWSHGRQHDRADTMTTTLVLLSSLIAMVSMVIGSSVALAFSLVGALSIVRFRTVVEDTRDTAFVIFAVVVGMAAGAGNFFVPMIGLPIVGLTAILMGRLQNQGGSRGCELTVRVGLGRDADELLRPVLSQYCEYFQSTSASTARQGASLEVTWAIRLKSPDSLVSLVAELNKLEGIQNVEIERQ